MENFFKKQRQLIEYLERSNQNLLFEEFLDNKEIAEYSRRLMEMEMFENDGSQQLNEDDSDNDIISKIKNDDFEINNIRNFIKSMNSGSRSEMLTPYGENDFGKMKTYKVNGYNAGFAIKNDGDIVSVHNNSGVAGIGSLLIKAAIKHGGNKLDHFDGFLTGFYSKLGFKLVSSDEWNDDYAPSNWKYKPINAYDPNSSIYANELKQYSDFNDLPENLKNVVERYKEGKPDIIYRKL